MAFQPLSVGDILMLSQTAWKISRAFMQGKKSAPTEFARVEREADNLSNVLKLAADTLHADDSILLRADEQTTQAVWEIFESAQKSLHDLESFVERYQIVKKRQTNGGYLVERSWSDAVMANYKTLKWTTEGGNIKQLEDMLQMHSNTITLTMQALQTRSLTRLERTVMPMAENVASIHERVNGDLGHKIDDVHRIIMAVANSTPSLQARDRAVDYGDHRRALSSSSVSDMPFSLDLPALDASPHSQRDRQLVEARCDSAVGSPNSPRPTRPWLILPSPSIEGHFETVDPRESSSTSATRFDYDSDGELPMASNKGVDNRASASVYTNFRPGSLAESPNSVRRGSLITISEYRALATPPWTANGSDVHPDSGTNGRTGDTWDGRDGPLGSPARDLSTEQSTRGPSAARIDLPSPAMTPDHPSGIKAATPRSLLAGGGSSQDKIKPPGVKDQLVADAGSTNPSFERSLFRNAAILCDTRGTLMEYARHNYDVSDQRYETEMVPICKEARICVIRKRENREHGGTKLSTSIWVLSDDGTVRCQQKLSERSETIPYCSFFEPEKISIAGSTADELVLRCHGANWSDPLKEEIKTGWVNYLFASTTDANDFQAAVFGRTLIGSFRTAKTTVLHEGFKGVFAFEEQFAKLDRLRLFEDDGVTTAGAEGGVLALLHVSSTFGEGWARWWMNSSRQQVYIKPDGEKCIKIKGLDVAVPGSIPVTSGPARRPSILDEHVVKVDAARMPLKRVTGLRIEFETKRERDIFSTFVARRVQERMLPLPYIG